MMKIEMEDIYMRKRNIVTTIGLIFCLGVFAFSALQVYQQLAEERKQNRDFEDLAQVVEQEDTKIDEGGKLDTNENGILKKYTAMAEQNPDMVGWIKIEGTSIDYPVMWTPDHPDFYLKHNFEKEYSEYGVPYIPENCSINPKSDNLVIYGHHMKNGKMFGALMEYTGKDFCESHKWIQFDTLTEQAEYEVVAVFKTTVYDGNGFAYYDFTDAESEQEFDEYIKKCKKLALYETGVTAQYGDQLIMLSTCEYSAKNGRLVVVGKKKLF